MKILSYFGCILLLSVMVKCADEDPDPPATVEDVPASEEAETIRKKPVFSPPTVPETAFFALYFSSPSDLTTTLIRSETKKDGVDEYLAKYDGVWTVEVSRTSAVEGDYGLVLKSKARHHAISAKLSKPVDFSHDQLVVQYEVKFQNPMDCGGAYVKLISDQPGGLNLKEFNDKTPYTIMFGPDKCGLDHKLHFIFRHKNPISGEYEEKHARKPKTNLDRYFSDQKTHLYTLVLNSDNTFEIYVDQTLLNSGSLLSDFDPPIIPAKEIDDPNDKKPADWDDREKIVDPEAIKPDDWDETQPEMIEDKDAVKPDDWLEDEPLLIDDPSSQKPADWDVEMDGEWAPPKIDNPKCKEVSGCGPWTRPKIKNPLYKGKWSAPFIDNPNYKGTWKAKRIPNPNYFEDEQPYRRMAPIAAIGLELWSMTEDIVFDNFIIASSKKDADAFAAQTWTIKADEERRADPKAQSVVDAIQEVTREKPWVWGIVALVVVLPIVLIIAYCYMGGSSSNAAADQRRVAAAAARRKKTDEPSPDVPSHVPNYSGDASSGNTSPGGSSVAQEEVEASDEDAVEEEKAASPKAALESDSESDTEKVQQSASEKSASSGDETTPERRVKKRHRKE